MKVFKKFLLAALLFTVALFCAGQAMQLNFKQFGMATQEMKDVGLCAAHSSIPLGSKAIVTNQANNKQVEVTIIKRLPPSPDRIIDLSSAAAAAIGLRSVGQVVLESLEGSSLAPSQIGAGAFASTISPGPYINGRIRLMLHEGTGRFSLYYVTDAGRETYEPIFLSQDPRTSYLAVIVNNRVYKLGESAAFRTRLGGSEQKPAIIYDAPFMTVTQEFNFIRTGSSQVANGVKINITLTNKTSQSLEAGLRFLLDTTLAEKAPVHFTTDKRHINSETLLEALSNDTYWACAGEHFSLRGSLIGQDTTRPDFVHFANWKRLYDAIWKVPHVPGRNFNLLPYSIGDSAVCYYYDPSTIPAGVARTISIMLYTEDTGVLLPSGTVDTQPSITLPETQIPIQSAQNDDIKSDLVTLQTLLNILNEYETTGTGTELELTAIELRILEIKQKHGIY